MDVMGHDPFTTSEGAVEYFPNLAGHRDAGQTECPGDRLYPLLPGIREKVAAQVTAVHGPTTGYWTATADGRVLPFGTDRKSTRLNSSHSQISYAVFCLKKNK